LARYADLQLTPEQMVLFWQLFQLMLGVALTCFVVSELTGNYSQVDKLWSLIPIVYVWYVAAQSGLHARSLLMASLVTVWGLRLTYNFWRRGGYHWIPWKGEEDYRWGVLRANPLFRTRWSWSLFNLFFISLYQNTLILLFTLPALAVLRTTDQTLNWLDILAAALFLTFVVLETLADQQQWEFQEEKYRRIATGTPLTAPYDKGFCTVGLWGRVRHPNYASEQAIWLSFYLFSIAATGSWLNWSLTGSILLVLLFVGSSNFSEKISAAKYPAYQDYQQQTPRFFPKLF
jgi:steroid 5-alpha reductase family enzyme